MTDIERGRGSHRGVYFLLIAALGFALSGCGGGASSSSAASAPESSSPAQQTAPAPGDTTAPAPTQGSSGGSTTSSGSGTSTGTSSGSGSTGSNPPTASAGSVTLNWVPPTENVDGTPLTNLAGYDIHYGTASGKYTQTISVSNAGISTYVVQNLTPGTYYFSVTAVNSAGTESPMSSEVSTTVN